MEKKDNKRHPPLFSILRLAWDSASMKLASALTILAVITFQLTQILQLHDFDLFVLGMLATSLLIVVLQLASAQVLYRSRRESGIVAIARNREIPGELGEIAPYEAAHVFSSKLYGLSYEDLFFHGTVQHDGSVTISRRSNLISYSKEGLHAIDHYLVSNANQGAKATEVTSVDSPFVVLSTEIHRATAQSLELTININPPLLEGEAITLDIKEKTPPGAVSLTYQEMEDRSKRFPYESFFWEVKQPTRHLQLRVLIPLEFSPKDSAPDVWYGPGRVTPVREYRRIENRFLLEKSAGFTELTLDVLYPVLGLMYAIKWIQPGLLKNPED